ncbi:aldehyde dehydrogenase family protein, partial [Salmonella enterica]
VERIVFGKLVNAGQTCIAPDYVMVPRERVGEFTAAVRRTVGKLYPNLGAQQQYASIVSDRQYERLSTLRDDAAKAGARIEPMSDAHDIPA